MNRRQRRQLLDQTITTRDGLPALHRLAVAIDRTRRQVAFAIGKRLVELGREAVRQIVQHIFARRNVDLDVAPFLGRDFGKPAFHQCLAGRDDLDHGGMAVPQIALDGRDQRWRLHRRDEMVEEALLGALEGERAADLACAFSVPVAPVMFAARMAALRLLWMILKAPA